MYGHEDKAIVAINSECQFEKNTFHPFSLPVSRNYLHVFLSCPSCALVLLLYYDGALVLA